MIQIILLLAVAVIALVVSARYVEKSFIEFAHKFKINEFFLGFVILGLVTSLPEITIALFASKEAPQLSMGNLIGATTVLLTLIIGISAVKYKNISFTGKFAEKEVVAGILLMSAMILVFVDRNVAFVEGVILLAFYALYTLYLSEKLNNKKERVFYLNISTEKTPAVLMKLIVGCITLIIASSYVVTFSEDLAKLIGISESLIGILLLAIGTNLPEITILILAKTSDEQKLALGNFFGSACVNAGILGLLAILSGGFVITDFETVVTGIVILALSLLYFAYFSWTGRKIDRREGILLIALYAAMIITEILIRIY